MGVILRPYQQDVETGIFEAWQKPRADNTVGTRNVLAVAPTGAGKTAIMSSVTKKITSPSASIAHRQELVSQISLALARNEIYHDIIAAEPVIRFCIGRHIEELGKNFHHAKAPVATAGVQTIIRRGDSLKQWCSSVGMWNIDEAHHVTPDNSWGKAVNMFPNAFGLGFTASPLRADRKPLGRALGGIFDHMVLGPTMRELIRMGYLSEYRLIAPTLSIDRAQIPISEATGELNQTELRKAAHKSTVTGDIVENYLKFASGMRGIAFVVDIEQAKETAERFNAAGVKAMAISSKTPDLIRQDAIRRFSRGDLTVLVNVDLFGEGFDVPAVEVVMMGRPTESFRALPSAIRSRASVVRREAVRDHHRSCRELCATRLTGCETNLVARTGFARDASRSTRSGCFADASLHTVLQRVRSNRNEMSVLWSHRRT
jgi:DNA repair protein RadD